MNAKTEVYAPTWKYNGDLVIHMKHHPWDCVPICVVQDDNFAPWINTCRELTMHPPCQECNFVGAAELLFNKLMEKLKYEQH
jgi:hypothetical protein